jgi:hypothetical protein
MHAIHQRFSGNWNTDPHSTTEQTLPGATAKANNRP